MPVAVKSICSPIDIGCVLTTPIGEFVEIGYYSDGTNWYYVSANDGIVTNKGLCEDLTTTSTTSTTTTTIPPTTTTTTTLNDVNLYAKLQDTYSSLGSLRIEYSIDGINWEDFEMSQIDSTVCEYKNTIVGIPNGTTLYLRTGENFDVVEHYSIIGSSVCPDSGANLCLTSFVVNAATDVAFTVLISGGSTILCTTTTTTSGT